MRVYVCVCVCVCVRARVCVCMYVCMYVYVCVDVHACVCMCTYVHTYVMCVAEEYQPCYLVHQQCSNICNLVLLRLLKSLYKPYDIHMLPSAHH